MSGVFRASDARPYRTGDDEPRICINCLSECESNERYDDCVRCPECAEEDLKHSNDWLDAIDERESRERIA